jgi:anti-sigma factor RsiW
MNEPETNDDRTMSAYLDEDLSPEARAKVDALLEQSPEAKADLESLRSMIRVVASLDSPHAPDNFLDKLDRRIRRRRNAISDRLANSMISLPLQLLCILVILVGATIKLMSVIEESRPALEPSSTLQKPQAPPSNELRESP